MGPASDGEVEDYILGITSSADMMIVKTGQPPVANTGDLMTYTVEIRNNEPDAALDGFGRCSARRYR